MSTLIVLNCGAVMFCWQKLLFLAGSHLKNGVHEDSVLAADKYRRVQEGKEPDILCSLSTAYNKAVAKNRQILKSIVECIIFCGRQNIALRGHDDISGNFQALLKFQVNIFINDLIWKIIHSNIVGQAIYRSPP